MAYVIAPELFATQRMAVAIETGSALSYGQTVCDQFDLGRRPAAEKNATVALRIDVPAFWRLQLDALAAANAVSSMNTAAA